MIHELLFDMDEVLIYSGSFNCKAATTQFSELIIKALPNDFRSFVGL
jgi:hypothetical protein